MSLTQAQTEFLNILYAVFSCGTLPEISDPLPVFRLAEGQELLPQVYDAVRGAAELRIPADVLTEVRREATKQVVRHIAGTGDQFRIYASLRHEGLHPLVMKGALCAALYPVPRYRVTADLDLLVMESEFDACHAVLCRCGLHPDCSEEALHDDYEVSYISADRSVCIELHRSPFEREEASLNAPFSGAFGQAQQTGELLTMPAGMHLLFLLLHAYKHFIYSGVGVRQVCDIGLWAREYGAQMDWQWLYDCCSEVRAEVFAACLFRIAQQYVGIHFDLPDFWRDAATDCESLLLDMLEGGIYGSESLTRLHTASATVNAVKASRRGESESGFIRTLFPNRRYIAEQYPYVRKHSFLLPVAWVERLFRYLSEVSTNDRSSASGSVRLAKQRLQLLKDYKIIR